MQEIKAIIQPFMLERVLRALVTLHDLPGLTVSEVAGWGRTQADDARDVVHHGGHAFASMKKIEIVVADHRVAEIVETIRRAAHTGNPGDGKIFVSEVGEAVKIRSGQKGDAAI